MLLQKQQVRINHSLPGYPQGCQEQSTLAGCLRNDSIKLTRHWWHIINEFHAYTSAAMTRF